jgi:hypothetical protein
MPEQNLQFEALLEQQNKSFQEARPFNDWTPPVGQYTTYLKAVDTGVAEDKKSKEKYPWWNLSLVVVAPQDEALNNKETRVFVGMNRPAAFKTTINHMYGAPLPDDASLVEANDVIMKSIGQFFLIKVTESDQGKTFTDIKDRIEQTEDIAAPAPEVVATPDAPAA